MSTRNELDKALAEMRSTPFFNDFVKTLEARKADVVARILSGPSSEVEVLRGEARAYDYIINASRKTA